MGELEVKRNCLGFEIWDEGRLVTLYRAVEEIAREESPKPCFAPIYTPSGKLITQYRPGDHAWHTGLYYGWVHVNDSNLWGGPWYLPEKGEYVLEPGTHGRQAHVAFDEICCAGGEAKVVETVHWQSSSDRVMATERRSLEFHSLTDRPGTMWRITSGILPEGDLEMASSRAAGYSGLELRMGPPFSEAAYRTSEGVRGHENIMKSKARWCCAVGACGGAVVMMDHPSNPRHPTNWFVRASWMGAGLLMEEDMTVPLGQTLALRYGFLVLDADPEDAFIESQFDLFAA